jgi:hypothetical protein
MERDGGGLSHLLGQGFRRGRTCCHLGSRAQTLGQIDAIGVDEIQYSKGHKYLILVYQIDLGVTRLLWVGKERTIESFQGFFTTIGEEITAKIVLICSDMWEHLKVTNPKAEYGCAINLTLALGKPSVFQATAKTAKPRPLRPLAPERKCARSHPRHGPRRTTARKYHSGKWRLSRRAHPWAKRPDKTSRGHGLLFDSLVATWSLLVRAVYTRHPPRGSRVGWL